MGCSYYLPSPLFYSIRRSSQSFFKSLALPIPFQRLIPVLGCSTHPQSPANSRNFSTPAKNSFTWDDVFQVSGFGNCDPPILSGFFDKISACNRNIDKHRQFLPFVIEDQIVGFVHKGFADILRSYRDVFVLHTVGDQGEPSNGYVTLQGELRTPEERTNAVEDVIKSLGEEVIPGIRNEHYAITSSFGAKEFFSLERAACPYFGIKAYGVHMNGYIERNGEKFLWIGKRSEQKSTFPGMLDHLVAGGLPHGISCQENMIKECEEEAGIPRSVAKNAKAVGAVSYSDINGYRYKRDVLFCYDLKLPEDFVPSNQDGEVESFRLIPVPQVMNIINQTGFFKSNCCLVIIDFLIRHGYVDPDDPGYLKLLQSLRSGDCS